MSIEVDTSGLEEFAAQIAKLADKDAFMEACVKELGARLWAKVDHRTPVMTGQLRRGWNIDANVKKVGSTYTIELSNDTDYASYVENGHRTANGSGFVPGQFMLTISEKEIQNMAPAILDKKLAAWLNEVLE